MIMGYSRKFEELLREFGAYEDEDVMEAMTEAYSLGCKEERRRSSEGGYGNRDDDGYEDGFREDWSRGGRRMDDGYGERRGVKNTGRYAGEYRRRRGY